jgi:hypothetical protein
MGEAAHADDDVNTAEELVYRVNNFELEVERCAQPSPLAAWWGWARRSKWQCGEANSEMARCLEFGGCSATLGFWELEGFSLEVEQLERLAVWKDRRSLTLLQGSIIAPSDVTRSELHSCTECSAERTTLLFTRADTSKTTTEKRRTAANLPQLK